MKTLLFAAILLSALQFVRPSKNQIATDPSLDLFARFQAPSAVRETLRNACYDCHSNQTRYPWYSEIQPAGWMLARHVENGKRELNLSEFGKLEPRAARQALEAIADEVAEKRMPLASYTWAHPDARLSPQQVEQLVAWAESAADQTRSGSGELATND